MKLQVSLDKIEYDLRMIDIHMRDSKNHPRRP